MSQNTFFWHDYETFGTDPQRDKAVQFAGVRTDLEFNVIGEPVTYFCKPSDDCLPHPEACFITGITPRMAAEKGIVESEFIAEIHSHLAEPNTCTVGYNSIRFDDEVTRNLLYRNFYDPYAREWQNGNSRWDLIDVVRATRALRPDGIQWPDNEEGQPSFRLEDLTSANAISHESAHDALSDVYATISIAKLVKDKQPRLYHYLFANRTKHKVFDLLQLGAMQPLIHVSGMYPASQNCLAVVVALAEHPGNSNGIIVYDLVVDPAPLLSLSVDEIKQRLFTAKADLPEGVDRIPLKTVHANKCPVLAPLSVIRPEDAERLQYDKNLIQQHLQQLKAYDGLAEKVAAVFEPDFNSEQSDPDLLLYQGGFFSPHDKREMARLRNTAPEKLSAMQFDFSDPRLHEMLIRYKGRNFPGFLTESERKQWYDYCFKVFTDQNVGPSLTLNAFKQRVEKKSAEQKYQSIASELTAFARMKEKQLEAWGREVSK